MDSTDVYFYLCILPTPLAYPSLSIQAAPQIIQLENNRNSFLSLSRSLALPTTLQFAHKLEQDGAIIEEANVSWSSKTL